MKPKGGPLGPRPKVKPRLEPEAEFHIGGTTMEELGKAIQDVAKASGMSFEEAIRVETTFDGRWLVDADSFRMFGLVRSEPTHVYCRCVPTGETWNDEENRDA